MLKEEVEELLKEYALHHPGISISAKRISTNIYKNDIIQMWIYYRTNEIRVTIKSGTPQHGEYFSLLEEQLVFQKNSANPYEAGGRFSFFVAKKNIPIVIDRLLMSEQCPTDAQMANYYSDSKQYQPKNNSAHRSVKRASTELTVPVGEKTDSYGEKNVVIRVEPDHRIEKKLDYLIGAFSNIQSEKTETVSKTQTEEKDKRFRIEPTQSGTPYLFSKNKVNITGLVFSLKLVAIGNDSMSEQYRLFFTNKNGDKMSLDNELTVSAGSEYVCKFELVSAASEEEKLYLAVQGRNALEDEVRQIIEFPVNIAFTGDFGL